MSPTKRKRSSTPQKRKQGAKDSSDTFITTRSTSKKYGDISSPSRRLRASSVKYSTSSAYTSPSTGKHSVTVDVKKTTEVKKPATKSQRNPAVLKSPTRTVSTRRTPRKTPMKLSVGKIVALHSVQSPVKPSVDESPVARVITPSRAALKRISSTSKSPQSKGKRLTFDNIPQTKAQHNLGGNCDILNDLPSPSKPAASVGPVESKILCQGMQGNSKLRRRQPDHKNRTTLPSDPELSGKFLRRKWYSLKAHGGFTCLRSAILTPEEIAQEVIQHSMVYTPKGDEANFFTTKLMVRLSSRLPPTRARPSCEELVHLINSRQRQEKLKKIEQPKGEGTAIRVKVERRSFTDALSRVTKSLQDNPIDVKSPQPRINRSALPARNQLSKVKERELALKQLKNMRYWRGGKYRY